MNILHINSNYFYTNLHKELIDSFESNISNVIFSPLIKNAKNIKVKDQRVISPICFNKVDRLFFTLKQNKIKKSFYNSIVDLNFDVIHAHTLFTDGNLAYEINKKHKIPYIVTVRNTDINSFFKKRFNLRRKGIEILLNASKIIFLSDSYKTQLINEYVNNYEDKLLINSKSYIVPNGINNFWFEKESNNRILHQDTIKILFVGRIEKNKNITTTVSAINNLIQSGKNIEYNIVGKVHDKTLYNQIISNDFVNYYEALPKEQLLNIYQKNDIFIMPSIYESFGLVYAEALSQGLPIIYSKGQGFDNQFREGVVGYGVDKYDPEDIVNKIELIINNYEDLSKNAIIKSKKFLWDNISRKHIKVYIEAIKEE